MHELAIAESIIETVLHEREVRGLDSVHVIGLKIGVLSGVIPEALQFGFEAAVQGTSLEKTRLEIQSLEATIRCPACREEFELDDLVFLCPECGTNRVEMIEGDELEIAYLEVDETLRS
jgi:hydrogenase nickel incorporation protein HypA/HybF